ncbi:MAG: NAD(P)-binding domain-containing protein, partial [Methylobacteriaceae bacterium]|nr:NAD(P)-binding domain-containing protein [Methylobacteriaceae bacterium]
MRIGIIGSGNMGRAIGTRLSQLGHQVLFGARRREQAQAAAGGAPGASAG